MHRPMTYEPTVDRSFRSMGTMVMQSSRPLRGLSMTAGTRRSSPKRRSSPPRMRRRRYGMTTGCEAYHLTTYEQVRDALRRASRAPDPEHAQVCACERAHTLGLKGHFPSCTLQRE